MKDLRGVDRGACNNCGECADFIGKVRCDYCDCAAAKHVTLSKTNFYEPCEKAVIISIGYDFISNYMIRYTFSAFPLYE